MEELSGVLEHRCAGNHTVTSNGNHSNGNQMVTSDGNNKSPPIREKSDGGNETLASLTDHLTVNPDKSISIQYEGAGVCEGTSTSMTVIS